jgi:hypothetical protein
MTAPDGEAFYFLATANLNTSAGKSLLSLGTEAAYAAPGVGQESVFNRTRIRINTPNTGTYTVTWPYGKKSFTVTSVDTAKYEINETIDLGCIAATPDNTCADGTAPNFSDVTSTLQPFLKWDSSSPPAPVGFLGDNATPHKVTGSPYGTNVFRIDGPNIGGPNINTIQTDQFVVQGKVAGPLASTPAKVAEGTSDVNVRTSQTVTLKNLGSASLRVSSVAIDPKSANPTDFAVTANTCTSALGLDAICTVTVSFTPSATGARTANLLVTHNQIRSPMSIPLKGFGRTPGTAAVAALSPTSLDLGTVHVGSVGDEQIVQVANLNGTAPLNVTKVALTGPNASDFRLVADCTAQRVDPGYSCPVGVAFAPLHDGTRKATLTITDDAPVSGSQQTVPLTGIGGGGIVAAGPVDPTTGFPSYYTDSSGLALDTCLGGPNCLATATATDLTPGTAGATGEAFYFNATSKMTLANGARATLVLATEDAYTSGAPVVGQEIDFSRIRFTVDKALQAGAQYKVTHPYGVDVFTASDKGAVPKNQGTQDIGCLAAPCNPGGWVTLMQSRIGPFLTWDTFGKADPALPAGYVGDAATNHKVIGSPFGTNVFRVEGPDVNPNPQTDACPTLPATAKADRDYSPANCFETDQFVVQGKVHTP